MRDLKNATWIKIKGVLFLFLGLGAAALLILDNASIQTAVLLAIAIWSFCRAYYFAFYVIERYVDSSYKFSGLWSCVRYLLKRR